MEVSGGTCPPGYVGSTTMTRYMLSVQISERELPPPLTDEEMHQTLEQLSGIIEDMKSSGAWVFSARLHGPETATVVRGSAGEVLTTDGPFAESKDYLGGFYVIEAEHLDAALDWAAKVTTCIRAPIEVRPIEDWKA